MNTALKLSYTFGLLTLLIGVLGLLGWCFHIPVFYTFLSHGASMKFNTALLTVLLGASVLSAITQRTVLASLLGSVIIVFCLLTFAEYLYNLNLHIDQMLIIDDLTDSRLESPGRMSLFTVISFFVITVGLGSVMAKKYVTGQVIMVIGLLITFISFVGVLYNISGLFAFGPYSAIALPTTLGLISASLAALFYTSDQGWLSEMASKHSAAITTRYSLLYFFLSLPVFIGLFLLMLSKARLQPELAIVVLIVGFAALTLPFAIILLKKLNRSDERSDQLTNELKLRSQQLYENNEELARTNKELDSLIHIISHDLKTPIAALKGSLDILEKKLAAQMQEKELQLLTIPRRSVRRLNESIQHLSEIIKAKQLADSRIEKIDLCLLVNDILSELQGTIQTIGAKITVDINDCDIYYERIHLHSIIQNLMTNALKFRHPQRPPVIGISANKIDDTVNIEVTDNGLGIPEKQQQQLFGKYARFHEHVEGTGVGLYLVQQLLNSHGGSIEFVSEEDKGTTFHLSLPIMKSLN